MSGAAACDLRLKQGATLALDLLFTDDNGAPVNIAAATVTMQVCDMLGNAVAAPTVTQGSELGWATVSTSTAGWPYGGLAAQVQVVANGATEISDTFSIVIERGVGA